MLYNCIIVYILHSPSAPYPALEAALQLIYCYWEGGSVCQLPTTATQGTTMGHILQALHETDIASHPHPSVLLAYYEVYMQTQAHTYIYAIYNIHIQYTHMHKCNHNNSTILYIIHYTTPYTTCLYIIHYTLYTIHYIIFIMNS